jgi:hypothetical protein
MVIISSNERREAVRNNPLLFAGKRRRGRRNRGRRRCLFRARQCAVQPGAAKEQQQDEAREQAGQRTDEGHAENPRRGNALND